MEVRCEKCGTEYGLDETLVGPSGTAVRCTVCGHVFRVSTAGEAGSESWILQQAGGATFPFDRLGTLQDWIAQGKVAETDLIAKTGGEWRRLSDLVEMKPFFEAARSSHVRRDITRPVAAGFQRPAAGEHAETIRAAPMAKPQVPAAAPRQPVQHVTAAYESAPPADQAPMARPAVPAVSQGTPTVREAQAPLAYPASAAPTQPAIPTPRPASLDESADTLHAIASPATQPPPRARPAPAADPQSPAAGHAVGPDFSQVPASGEEERWVSGRRVASSGPAWAETGQVAAAPRQEYEEEDDLSPPRRHLGRWIALTVMVLLVGGGFYLFMFQRDLVEGMLGGLLGSPAEDRYEAFFLKGRESFLLDTDLAFRQADREFQKSMAIVENDPATLATLAKMHAIWSQYLRDEEIDARLDAADRASGETEPDLREAKRLEREAGEKLDEARRFAEQARDTGADLPEITVALADVARLGGSLDEADALLAGLPEGSTDPGARYVKALIAIDRGKPTDEVVRLLSGAPRGEELLRSIYRRARVLAAAERRDEARRAIERVVSLNRDHHRARALEARLVAGLPVALGIEEDAEPALAAADDPADEEDEAQPDPADEPEKPAAAPASGESGTVGGTDAQLVRARRLQESGQTSQAMALYQTVIERAPGNIEASSGMGYCYLDSGNKGQAITWFRRALGGGGGSFGPAIIGLAETYKSQGQRAEALKWYRRYLEVQPGGKDARLARVNVERLEQELGKEPARTEPDRPPAAPEVRDEDVAPAAEPDPAPAPPQTPYGDAPAPSEPAEKQPRPAEDEPPPPAPPDPYSAEG